jgi:hypothetical protein
MSEIIKCLSVATKIETSGRSKINWITSKIEMIGILDIMNSRQYVPRIYTFKYWYELHNVRMILRTNCSAVIFPWVYGCWRTAADSGRGLGFVTCNLMIYSTSDIDQSCPGSLLPRQRRQNARIQSIIFNFRDNLRRSRTSTEAEQIASVVPSFNG